MMLNQTDKHKAKIAAVLEAIDCAFAGKPHPLILTPEQRRWRTLAFQASFYPRQPVVRAAPAPAADPRLPTHDTDSHGYGSGRYMGD